VELGSFSRVDRDPRGRTVTVVFGTKVPIAPVKGADDAAEAAWFSIDNLPPLAFDHQEILQVALPRLDSRFSK
jgi:8-oxo-dGTP diphosphatase